MNSRRLVAIVFTDIAGYTEVMGRDEAKALRALEKSRGIVGAEVEKHGGTVLDRIGDGTLSSFDSAVAAVDCAREIQQRVASEADFELRIGIHIGDVIVSESGVVGDGVNVASRIHGLADPGSICISERVYDDVRNHPEISAIPLGEQRLKNVNRRVTVYVIAPPGRRVAAAASRTARRRRVALAAGVLVLVAALGVASGLYQKALVMLSIRIPLLFGDHVDQEIGFVTSRDGTRIAYGVAGEGPAMVHVVGWLTHLERGFNSPTYSPDVAHWSKRFRYVRYDGRGAGLSDRGIEDFSLDAKIGDLEAVIDGLGLESPILYGLSAGGPICIGYAARHPQSVRALVLVSTAADGDVVRKANPLWSSLPDIMRSGWGHDNAAARQVFTSLLAPEADPVVHGFINELIRVSMTGEDAGSFFASLMRGSVSDLLAQIRVPTLIIHASGDLLVPIQAGGRELAAGIPGSRLVVLETNNHGIPESDPQHPVLLETVDEFLAEALDEPLH